MRPSPAQLGLLKAVHAQTLLAIPGERDKRRKTWRSMEGRWVAAEGERPVLTLEGQRLVERIRDAEAARLSRLDSAAADPQAPAAVADEAPALDLDALTRKWTAFADFQQLLSGGHDATGAPVETSYRPSLYPGRSATREDVAELRALADGYDAAQTLRGDARRAYRGDPASWTAKRAARPAAPPSESPPEPGPQQPIVAGKPKHQKPQAFRALHDLQQRALVRLAKPVAQLSLLALALVLLPGCGEGAQASLCILWITLAVVLFWEGYGR